MNNELLTLFDIKDDIVESFTIDNIGTYYEINIRFKPSVVCCDARIKTGLVKWKNQLVYGTMS